MKAYNSATNFVSALTPSDHSQDTLLYLPYYLFRCLLTAACILVKVLKSNYAQEIDDFEKGRRVFNDSILAIRRSSVTNNDTAAKAVKMLSCVWHSSIISGQSPPQLTVQSRFGARLVTAQAKLWARTLNLSSLTQDFIRTWRKEFGAIPQEEVVFISCKTFLYIIV
jgi:hypothetical protein